MFDDMGGNVGTTSNWRFYSFVLGAFLLLLPAGVHLYWGNLSVYCVSYIYCQDSSKAQVEAPWLIASYFISSSIGMILYDRIISFVGTTSTIVVGVLIFDLGIVCTYFSVTYSMLLVTITFGVLTGVGGGIIFAVDLKVVVEWDDGIIGLLTSVLASSYSIGSILVNQLITFYINPDNKVPDRKVGPSFFFSQPEIVNKVPNMFLILGAFSISCHVLGISLIRLKPLKQKSATVEDVRERDNVCSPCPGMDFSPWQMLRTRDFYVLWFALFVADIGFTTFANYYKSYGQVWISDDHIFAYIVETYLIVSVPARLLWGVFSDKVTSTTTVCVVLSCISLTTTFYYFAPMSSEWFMFIYVVLYGCSFTGIYNIITVVPLKLFGQKHFTTNVGILTTAIIAENLVTPMPIKMTLLHLGYASLFIGVGVLNCLGLILVVCVLRIA